MSPKKTILKTLALAHDAQGSATFTRPSDIPGFAQKPADYQKAVNELLKDRLIEGQPDGEGRMTIAVNPHRVGDVRKRIRRAVEFLE